jgi:hypothetical protein
MNWFVVSTGVLWICGAAQYALSSNWRMVIVSLCYAFATFALVGAK